jgi:hypothetical protein
MMAMSNWTVPVVAVWRMMGTLVPIMRQGDGRGQVGTGEHEHGLAGDRGGGPGGGGQAGAAVDVAQQAGDVAGRAEGGDGSSFGLCLRYPRGDHLRGGGSQVVGGLVEHPPAGGPLPAEVVEKVVEIPLDVLVGAAHAIPSTAGPRTARMPR